MIVSHKHRFVFVHIPKTAGQSITSALAPYCCPQRDTVIPRDFGKHWTAEEIRREHFYNNDDAWWWQYFSFAVVRNPWELLHSSWTHSRKYSQTEAVHWQDDWGARLRRTTGYQSFEEYARGEYLNRSPGSFWRTYCMQGDPPADIVRFAVRHECLQHDWPRICAAIGLPTIPQLTRENSISRPDYRLDYSDQLAADVGRAFAYDIERFGYCFDGLTAS